MPFTFTPLPSLPDAMVIEPRVFSDERGWFLESFKQSDFARAGLPPFVQENHASTRRGGVRALHYQVDPKAQGKLVRCIAGAVFDVAVDLRRGSPTFARWAGVELTAANRKMLYIPPGFAHGLMGVSDESEILYQCTAEYSPQHERGVRWDDPTLGIEWPSIPATVIPRDRDLPLLQDADVPFTWRKLP